VSIIKDLGLLDGVYPLERAVIVGGIDSLSAPLTAQQGGHLPGFGPVLYVPGAACNVIAQATCASRKYHVSMDYPQGEDGHAVYTVRTPTSTLTFELLPGHAAHYATNIRAWVAAQRSRPTEASWAHSFATVASNAAQWSKHDRAGAVRAQGFLTLGRIKM